MSHRTPKTAYELRNPGLSSTEIAQLPELDMGEGLWRIGERSFMVRHLCTPDELSLFDTNARMSGNTNGSV